MFTLRKLALALAITGLLSTPLLAADTATQPVRILASLPITYGLGELLLKDSNVTLERAAAANLPGSRQSAYFSGRGAPALHKLATNADAVIGLRSVWSDDPLYPMARRSNIRIVEVDAARPVDGSLPGIAVQPGVHSDGLNSQPWLTSNNMGRMADVIAADLVRLAPDAKPKIEANLAGLKQRLLKLSADSEAQLAKADNLAVVSLSDRLDYLIGGLNLERVEVDHKGDETWTPESLQALTQTLKDNEVALVLDHRQPAAAVKAAIAEGGSELVVVTADGADPVAELQDTIDAIVKVLSHS
ncbi:MULTISPECIES: metal ABC transporter solute-binding protein, Zn/Mn family [Pseudomonas]|jgi:ABC-type Zn uptake system ZnuABC Zn-binding protein ZnuA|uniref:ABC-type Zn uptake system ZnuABC, Zn-binding component ZnuA n=1 Tax=Pseudomonas psychrophila TaxID=122355 RepID=A0A8I1FQ74_9PSED|nr:MULTISPECIES: zinc ABC transporter substrate-binding protein [Pseudomonas]EPJ93455.1 putative ABC transporter, periplasmic substrate-binding protein [Pseudomonas psychrophila]KAB0487659.1 metal ABC transporter substrate-binding protein [Pseudomonas psychrophila]KMM97208.1 metal ABC transporter substrate-binding protein [Pseudomonas psychrophila]KOX64482.1 metal ABC transporter substrate-binding protein [Pseudomonas psychrophila]MBJ2258696.1 zinc ABC transporter substrate-binding protein [Ps